MGAPGCDDAPYISVNRTETATPFTLVMPYYENPKFLGRQLEGWLTMIESTVGVAKNFKVIIVDDGSPDHPAEDVIRTFKFPSWLKHYRIDIDVRWNWLAARNIGAYHADEGWLLLTDMDHVLDMYGFQDVIWGERDKKMIYRFSRREHTGKVLHPHPNSWLMTKKMYWKVGGYDEACSGYYGTDGDYRRRCAATAPIRIQETQLIRYEYQLDASTSTYKRKQPEDAAVKRMIRARDKNWQPRVLSFPYHEITE